MGGIGRFTTFVVLGILTLSAAAQQEGLRDRDPSLSASKKIASDLQQATLHFGDFYLLSRFQLSDIGYGQEFFTPTGEEAGKITLGASAPQRLYFVPNRRIVFSADANPSYTWLGQSGTRNNQFGFSSRGDVQFLFNHVWLNLWGARARELRPQFGEINRVVTIHENQVGARGELKYSSRTSLIFSGDFRGARYPPGQLQPTEFRSILGLNDRKEHNFRTSLNHKTFPLTSLSLAYERSNYSFERTTYRNGYRQFVGLGVNFDNGTTVVQAEAGPGHLRFNQPGQKEFSGTLGKIAIARRAAQRTRFSLSANRDLDFSIYAFNNYYILERLAGTIEYSATRRLTVRYISQYGRDLYEVAVPLLPLRRDSISWNAVGWDYGLRRIRGGFDVGYYRRNSNVPDVDVSHGIRAVLHLSITP